MSKSVLNESNDRFNVWLDNINEEINDFHSVADSAAVAAVRGSIDWRLIEIAFRNHSQAVGLEKIKADALLVRGLNSSDK